MKNRKRKRSKSGISRYKSGSDRKRHLSATHATPFVRPKGHSPISSADTSQRQEQSTAATKIKSLRNKQEYQSRRADKLSSVVTVLKAEVKAAQDENNALANTVAKDKAHKTEMLSSIAKLSEKLSDRSSRWLESYVPGWMPR